MNSSTSWPRTAYPGSGGVSFDPNVPPPSSWQPEFNPGSRGVSFGPNVPPPSSWQPEFNPGSRGVSFDPNVPQLEFNPGSRGVSFGPNVPPSSSWQPEFNPGSRGVSFGPNVPQLEFNPGSRGVSFGPNVPPPSSWQPEFNQGSRGVSFDPNVPPPSSLSAYALEFNPSSRGVSSDPNPPPSEQVTPLKRDEDSSDPNAPPPEQGVSSDSNAVTPLKREEEKTTLMIKNIPYKYRPKKFISMADTICIKANSTEGPSQAAVAYDVAYLPIDFSTGNSKGFGFLNLTSDEAARKFIDALNSTDWDWGPENHKWTKKPEAVYSKIQGKEALVNHWSGRIFNCDTDEYLPIVFNPPRDGTGESEMTVIAS